MGDFSFPVLKSIILTSKVQAKPCYHFSNVEIRVRSVDYKLFQVSDLICTLEMLYDKAEHSSFSESETEFFGSIGRFKKDCYQKIVNKRL